MLVCNACAACNLFQKCALSRISMKKGKLASYSYNVDHLSIVHAHVTGRKNMCTAVLGNLGTKTAGNKH